VILLTLAGLVFVAAAGSGISFSGQTPVGGSVLSSVPPLVSLDIGVNQGLLIVDDIFMKLNGSSVNPSLDSITGGYRLSYVPGTLANGVHTVYAGVYDSVKGTYETTNWSFTVDAAPNVLERYPASGATLNISNPQVTLRVRDTYDNLNAMSVKAKLNGNPVATTFKFKGYEQYDSCSNTTTWIITDRKEGTISLDTPVLENGTHTVEVSIADTNGNVLVDTWFFDVVSQVKFSNFTPANNTVTGLSKPTISVRAVDGTIDMESIEMLLDGVDVTAGITIQPIVNGYNISYTPSSNLLDKQYTVMVNMFDTYKGVYESTSWKFTVDAAPKPSKWYPAKGSTLTFSNPKISLYVKDTYDNLNSTSVSAKINGVPFGATFAYETVIDACTGAVTAIKYREGTIEVNTSVLEDGIQNVEISIADVAGNVMTETWSFTVAELPKISSLSPANKSELASASQVSAVVTDNVGVDWNSVKLYINNSHVPHTYDEATGKVTYDNDFITGNYNVKLEARDLRGNLATSNWSFIVSSTGPTLTKFLYLTEGMTITNGMLRLHAQLNSTVEINDNVMLTLNGEPLDFAFRYQGYVDSCTGVYIITSLKEVFVDYNKKVADGDFTVVLTAEDKFGNLAAYTRSFTVRTFPVISNVAPFKYGLQELQPTISATVTDNDSFQSIVLKLNGVVVDADYNPGNGKLTYTPSVLLDNESNYTVSLTAIDRIGLTTSKTWGFNINTYPDMLDSNISMCLPCHGNKSNRSLPYEAVHLDYFWDHYGTGCDYCHNYVTALDVCGRCHDSGSDLYQADNFPPHGLNPNKKYSPKNTTGSFPLRVTTNRENWDCIICHQPGAGTRYRVSGSTFRLLNNHDIPQLHVAPLTQDNESCIQCHARSLTREHAREGRKDRAGQTITCLTCHVSVNTQVQGAIAAKDTTCTACHDINSTSGHSDMHVVSLGDQCVTCHGNNMTSEKVYHQDDGCKGCHNNSEPRVQSAIQLQNRTCFGCHETPHGVKMTVVRDDIALYSGLVWSKPDPAVVWAGEGWLPEELNNDMALVLFSAVVSLDKNVVSSFYKSEMVGLGWVLVEESADNGGFSLLYRKSRRHCLIRYVQTAGGGYRVITAYN
jgi:hypothetical protein